MLSLVSGFIRGPGEDPKPLTFSFHDKYKQGPLLSIGLTHTPFKACKLKRCKRKSRVFYRLQNPGITEHINLDRYLHPHFHFYMREIRTVVYSQFLESYKSVTIEAMAKAFSVIVDFIDLELSLFIAAGKLHCKIDKVASVLETNRPDAKNALYPILYF
ncbi:unnamed protein product [Lactuca virosa]|uniref:PCI domain-containing protein n=1 Tax=Lactuca virosa TaxID=75947 RepID=A0AAU9P5I0_9ASTR|nr:unnamed protein product [Lactuca virosa]